MKKKLIIRALGISALLLTAQVSANADANSVHLSNQSNSNILLTNSGSILPQDLWNMITALFSEDAESLAPGVTQDTINNVRDLVMKNATNPVMMQGMLDVVQQAQDLLGSNPITPVQPEDLWNMIIALFSEDAESLAPGVTQDTINNVRDLVMKNATNPVMMQVMLDVVQQAQDLLDSNPITPVQPEDLWNMIIALFSEDAESLAPGVTQDTINNVRDLVMKNATNPVMMQGMLDVVQQAQNLLLN